MVSGASGSSALAGRLPQCLQQLSAVSWERTRDSTAVNERASGSEAGAGGRLRRDGGDHVVDEQQRPGSWRTSVTERPRRTRRGRARFSSGARTRFQSATADAGEVKAVSSVVPGSRAILGVGALLQAAMLVRRLRSAAAGERDAAECRLPVPRTDQWPAITFEAHHIQPGETGWMISGTLAVKDTHCPVRLQVTGPATQPGQTTWTCTPPAASTAARPG